MARSNLSQNHWAIKIGISRGHWSEIVNGKHVHPSPKTRERMLEVFKVTFDDLFEIDADAPGWSDPSFQAAVRDRYLVDEEIGQGGMGTVYLARDVKLGRQVAIKVLAPEAVSGIGVEQFLKEIRYTARLQHHNILGLHDAGEAASHPYYVMPYIKGGSLRQLLERRGGLSLDETLHIARGVAGALHHAHEHRVLHCDVKPENILIADDHVYVADFGISRAIHSEVFEWGQRIGVDSSAGTPAYVSPEQASGERNLDARADVYSFGCMVFEMLAGRAPFTGRNTMEVVTQRFTTEVPDLRDLTTGVPHAVAATIERAMTLVPERLDDGRAACSCCDHRTGHDPRPRATNHHSVAISRGTADRSRGTHGSGWSDAARGIHNQRSDPVGGCAQRRARAEPIEGGNHGETVARLAASSALVEARTDVRRHGGAYLGPRHRSQHRNLHSGQRNASTAVTV
jgi:serine/threonine protein kinase